MTKVYERPRSKSPDSQKNIKKLRRYKFTLPEPFNFHQKSDKLSIRERKF